MNRVGLCRKEVECLELDAVGSAMRAAEVISW